MPIVGVIRDEVAAGAVRARIHVGGRVEVEHALAPIVHERKPVAALAVVVGVDAYAEPGPLVERDGLGHVHDRQGRRRTHTDLAGEPSETVTAERDVIARTERDARLRLTAASAAHSRSTGRRIGSSPQQQIGWSAQTDTITPRSTTHPQPAQAIST